MSTNDIDHDSAGPRAAFFDLDRTLVRVNTAKLYVRWRARKGEFGIGTLLQASLWTFQYGLGLLNAEDAGARAAATLKGVEEPPFRQECGDWAIREVLPEISDAARRELSRCRDQGDLLVILSSSSPYVTEPVADELGIEHVLCSRLEIQDGIFTGGLAGRLCYGREKVLRAEEWASAEGITLDSCSFYTDSISDAPMLEAVGEPRVINPDPRLSLLARRRGWKIDRWL